jgi:hypothetical protein
LTLERDLYALPPERFVAARDEAVARARADGDRALAARIRALRRPTVAAWLVNLLALHRPEQVGELLELGTQLREAQDRRSGERMRELSSRRRAAIAALVGQARRLAIDAGRQPRDALPLAEVEATLGAAVADEKVAEAVRAGRLTKPVGYAGFGEPLRPELRVLDGGAAQTRPPGRDRQRGGAGRETRAGLGAAAGRTGTGQRAEQERRAKSGAGTERRAEAGAGRRARRPGEDETAGVSGRRERGAEQRERQADRRQREADRREREADRREREREEARAARAARVEAAENALRDATAAEREAARALDELTAELDRLRQAQVAAQTALREARLARRAAERDAHRAQR